MESMENQSAGKAGISEEVFTAYRRFPKWGAPFLFGIAALSFAVAFLTRRYPISPAWIRPDAHFIVCLLLGILFIGVGILWLRLVRTEREQPCMRIDAEGIRFRSLRKVQLFRWQDVERYRLSDRKNGPGMRGSIMSEAGAVPAKLVLYLRDGRSETLNLDDLDRSIAEIWEVIEYYRGQERAQSTH